VIAFMTLFCWIGPIVYPTNQTSALTALLDSTPNAPPSSRYPLGTDHVGFDMLGRIMYGGQVSLEVGFAAAAIATILGVLWGAVSGFFGGWVDGLMMRTVDVFLSIPILFLLILLAVLFGQSLSILIYVIAFTSWLVPARLVRGETLTLRVREYVMAVRIMGGSNRRIVVRHIIPNAIGTIIVTATFTVANSILALAYLGFLGLGVPAPQTDWGTMLNDGTAYALNGYWWEIIPTGCAIVLVVVALNFVGDALRDSFEVRLQRR
jgi:peptide/nickel transport system permease protein